MEKMIPSCLRSVAKNWLFVLFFFFSGFRLNAQIVTIPDANFVTYLQTQFPLCITGDQLDTQCPDVLAATWIFVSSAGISDLTGVEHFVSLQQLTCDNNSLTSLPALPSTLLNLTANGNMLTSLPTLPAGLQILYIGNNQLTSLPALPSSIIYFDCSFNSLTSLPTLPASLEIMGAAYNQITTLPALPLGLTELSCESNLLTVLPSLPGSLGNLNCSGNQLTVLPILPIGLSQLQCAANSLTVLPVLPENLLQLYCNNNDLIFLPTLPGAIQQLYCAYNNLTSLPDLDSAINLQILDCSYNPNLACLPFLPDYLEQVGATYFELDLPGTAITCIPNLPVDLTNTNSLPLCSLNDLVYNPNGCWCATVISGKVFLDETPNCAFDSGEYVEPYLQIYLRDDLGNIIASTFTDTSGNYSFYGIDPGDYSVMMDTSGYVVEYNCLGPVPQYPFSLDTAQFVTGLDFAGTCATTIDNGVTAIIPSGWVFPGLDHSLSWYAGSIAFCNQVFGSGEVNISINGPVTYVAPIAGRLTPDFVSGNNLTYTISDFDAVNFFNSFGVILATDTTATAGDSICVTVTVTTTGGDDDITNDVLSFCYEVVNSYDPNVKNVYPEYVLPDYDNSLTYTVHFQNTGSAPAINIKLIDTLDVLVKPETFELLSSSHAVTVFMSGDVATFYFQDIMLPDSASDPMGSIGTIQFKVKPDAGLPDGTVIENDVYIYFDYNTPVITNVAQTFFIQDLGVEQPDISEPVSVYPNPTTGIFTFIIPDQQSAVIRVFNLNGELIAESFSNEVIDISAYSDGTYFLEIITDETVYQTSIVKL